MNIKQIKAKKIHECHVCHESIVSGCEYIQERYKEGNRHYVQNRHIHCDAMINALNSRFLNADHTIVEEGICNSDLCENTQCGMGYAIYSCRLCQEYLLDPIVFNAARKSVIENGGADGK